MTEEQEEMVLRLVMPSADEQRAIICSLESDTSDESLRVYTVSQAWYDRWRAYVGLDHLPDAGKEDTRTRSVTNDLTSCSCSPTTKTTTDNGATTTKPETTKHSVSCETCGKETETDKKSTERPGPIEMDLTNDDNISVDEKVMRTNKVIIIIIVIIKDVLFLSLNL